MSLFVEQTKLRNGLIMASDGAGEAFAGWSTGERKERVSIGDRVFLLRQGVDPRGLVGSGRIVRKAEKRPHWDKERRDNGDTYYRARVRWDTLRETPVVLTEDLIKRFGNPSNIWKTAAGGRVMTELQDLEKRLLTQQVEFILLRLTAPPRPWVDTDAIPVIGDLKQYRPSDHDSLDANTQAKIFAALLIAKEVKPPFALGLLGDWGVGKSFFMRLMQENVQAVAGRDVKIEWSSDSVSRAAQIEFNAWHDVDSDLWASLASHIFDGLSEELLDSEDKEDKVVEIRRRLRRTIHPMVLRSKIDLRATADGRAR